MIEIDLMPVLFEEVGVMDLGVGSDCERAVRNFITPQDALYRSSSLAQRTVIQTNFRRFVKEMVAEAQRRGLPELRESTFAAARMKVCPLFPFC